MSEGKICRTPGCGKVIEGRGKNAVYCTECAAARAAEQRKAAHAAYEHAKALKARRCPVAEHAEFCLNPDHKYYYHHKSRPVLVQSGWRGRPCAGGGSSSKKYSE